METINSEKIKEVIHKAVLMIESGSMNYSQFAGLKFSLSIYLSIVFKCKYHTVLYFWRLTEKKMSPMQCYGLFRDTRALYWWSKGLALEAIANRLGYFDKWDLLRQFEGRQDYSLDSVEISQCGKKPCAGLCHRNRECYENSGNYYENSEK
jgi:hypothetical protein